MNKSPDIAATATASSSIGRMRFNLDWITRPIFGVGLAAIAVGSLLAGTWPFAVVASIAGVAAAREWHRIVENRGVAREVWISAVVIPLATAATVWQPSGPAGWIILGAGFWLVFASAVVRRARPVWHAAGVAYIGVPAILLVLLRTAAPHGPIVLIELFIVVWATDTGALFAGNLIGGPKLMPALSPRKTWAGTLGGVLAACAAAAVLVAVLRGNVLAGILFAFVLSVSAHAGDLLESWVKRQFAFKDSGGLIPGHGGALDRIDSTLTTSVVMAIAVFKFGLDPMFGARL